MTQEVLLDVKVFVIYKALLGQETEMGGRNFCIQKNFQGTERKRNGSLFLLHQNKLLQASCRVAFNIGI
jgi:hypothetical protein